mmetsp:Transcript_102381/g.278289  ORF Transcript_102381/g.278289 Transcript_102381/m.278289 type:complete len:215 (+) Transcript_102381:459-1103(+)
MRLRFEVTGFSARGGRADFGALRLLLSLLCISPPACPSFPLLSLSLSLSIVSSLASYLVWSDTALGAAARCPQASSHSDVRPWQRCPPPPRVLPFVGLPCRSSAALRAQAAGVLPASSPAPQCGRARARTYRTPSPPPENSSCGRADHAELSGAVRCHAAFAADSRAPARSGLDVSAVSDALGRRQHAAWAAHTARERASVTSSARTAPPAPPP